MQWLAEICVKRPVFATMLILSLVVVGAFSFFSLGVDLFPEVDFPTVTVTTVNPGASPVEIETEITEKIEEAANTVSGIDELRSTSLEGVSQVFVQFQLDKDVNIAAQEVENKIQLVIPDLPETSEQPTVLKLDSGAAPVLRIVVSAEKASLKDVTEVAKKKVKERIESINGVGQVQIVGGRERQINVWVDPNKMRSFNITPVEVTAAMRIQNLEFPSGRIDEGSREVNIRTLGKVRKVEDFENVIVAKRNGYDVRIKDIGTVEDGAEELRSQSFLNGKPAVTLIVSKQSGQNSVAVAHELKEVIKEIEPALPKGFGLKIVADNSLFIESSIEDIEEHLLVGSILATIVIFLFLWNFRSTFIAAIAIPTSIISTFAAMYVMGYTLNVITMLSLTLMVGIVVDDAIVVLENIYRFVEEKGMSPYRAAIEGTREIGLAVLATTLSLMAVFVPIGFMGGIVGRFMSSFGLTSAFAIGVSLLVSFTLTPMLAARLIKWKPPTFSEKEEEISESEDEDLVKDSEEVLIANEKDEENQENLILNESEEEVLESEEFENEEDSDSPVTAHTSKDSWFYKIIDGVYTKMLVFSMNHRWIIALSCLLVVLSIVPLFMFVGKNFLPVDDESQFEVSVRTDEGTSLQASTVLMERIASDLRKLEGVTDTLITVGGGQSGVVNAGTIYVKLTDVSERSKSQEELMVNAREILGKYPKNLRTAVQIVQAFSGGGFRNANVQFVIGGPDLRQLEKYSEALVEVLKNNKDAVDVDTTLISGKPELQLEIDRKKAADLGVRVGDISQALNILVAGQQATTFNEGTDQYEVVVRAKRDFRSNKENLKRLVVPSTKLGTVTLDNVVIAKEGTGPAAIDRINRQRQVTILANTKPGGSAAAITADLDKAVKDLNVPSDYRASYVGQSKEMGKAGFYFLLAISLSFVFMYIVLAAQFESFIHPVTILLTLPIAVPFGILSILIAGQTLNIFSGLGFLLLFGVVKKNAILVIDHINVLREKGLSREEAILQGNRDRLRPILMTTIALIAGMMPLVLSSGAGAATNRSVGVLIVGGQALCLLLTLLAVPVFYSYFDDVGNLKIFRTMNKGMEVVRRKTVETSSSILGAIWRALFIVTIALISFGEVTAQETKPTPIPSPTPVVEDVKKSSLEDDDAEKNVEAEKLKDVPTIAPSYESNERDLPDLGRVGVDMTSQKPISLKDAIVKGLENNIDIEVTRKDVKIAEFDLKAADGFYEPRFSGQTFLERATAPNISIFSDNTTTTNNTIGGNLRYQGFVRNFGSTYFAELSKQRLTTNNPIAILSPQNNLNLTLGFTQPLFGGRKFDNQRRIVEIAKKNLSLTDTQFRQKAIEITANIQRAYWDLTFALKNLQVQRDGVRDAKDQLAHNRRLVKEGVLAPIDIVAAETQVANLEQNVYVALEQVQRAENFIKSLIAGDREDQIWNDALVPTDSVKLNIPQTSLNDAMALALDNRPELEMNKVAGEINKLDQKLYRELDKPQIDLTASYSTSGVSGGFNGNFSTPFEPSICQPRLDDDGNQIPVDIVACEMARTRLTNQIRTNAETFTGGIQSGVTDLLANRYPTYRVGITFNLPLFGNRTTRANLGKTLVQSDRIKLQRQQLEQIIQLDVRNALQSLRTAEARLRAAAVARENSEKQYASEKRKLDAGLSDIYKVLERQTALMNARSAELQAQTELNKAIAELQRATGNSLKANEVETRLRK